MHVPRYAYFMSELKIVQQLLEFNIHIISDVVLAVPFSLVM